MSKGLDTQDAGATRNTGRTGVTRSAKDAGATRNADGSAVTLSADGSAVTLSAEGVAVTLSGNQILKGADLDVRRGEIVGLIGPSGSGKTTLARLLTGRFRPDEGRVTLGGVQLQYAKTSRPTNVAMVSQSPRDACHERWSLREIIAEPLKIAGKLGPAELAEKVEDCAERAKLDAHLLDRLPSQVSDGQLQRACVARVLALDPDFLICDEPTSMLDPVATAKIVGLLRDMAAMGKGILFISHDHRLLRACATRVLALRDGKIAGA